jgi:GST-like protein
MNDRPFVLYGTRGWGSVLVEAMLTQAGQTYTVENIEGFHEPGAARDKLIALNPLAQVPTLVLPDGSIMTESAAIALYLAELAPEAQLAPPPGNATRSRFLRQLIWLVAAVYPTFTYGDFPKRWAPGDPDGLLKSTNAHREALWRWYDTQVGAPWALGDSFSVLDIYICAMTHWRPRRAWFAQACPNLTRIALAADARPKLAPIWAKNFSVTGG